MNSNVSYLKYFIFIGFISTNQIIAQKSNHYEKKIDSVLVQLTLEEKIALLHDNGLFSSSGIPRLGIPDLQYTDGPHGIREEMEKYSWKPLELTTDSVTYFPTGTALGASWNYELAEQYGLALGEEARARGKDILLGPSVNIIRTPLGGRNYEYFSEDPFLAARMTVAYIKGVQWCDLASCVKHYLANNQEELRWGVNVQMDERTLREIYLPVYRAAVQEANVRAVMGAYNKFRGTYCCENGYILNNILKNEWGFEGIVISDWNATHSTLRAAKNGLDVEMGTYRKDPDSVYFARPLLNSVKLGLIDESIINDKARRVLRIIFANNMMDKNRVKGEQNTEKHRKIAYQVAAESVVLLKNDKKLLPLNPNEIKNIAVIGDNATRKHAQGGFSAAVKARYEVTPLEGLQRKLGKQITIHFARGYNKQSALVLRRWMIRQVNDTLDKKLLAEAVKVARENDLAIIFAGLNHDYDTETMDRPDMKLPYAQDQLIRAVVDANPRTIVVFIAGSPLDLSGIIDLMPAVVWGWYNGSETGNALADILLGAINPSGKLPFTMPLSLENSPAHALNAYPGENMKEEYKEGILVGYRWFDTKAISPLFCFGHGLSYTDFSYSPLSTDKKHYQQDEVIKLSFQLKNNGSYVGAETVQLYVSDPECSVWRPLKELKGFRKVFLEPGEEKLVALHLPVSELAFFDRKQMKWKVEPGEFELMLGSSSRDIRLSTLITVE